MFYLHRCYKITYGIYILRFQSQITFKCKLNKKKFGYRGLQQGYYSKALLCGRVPMETAVVVAGVTMVVDAVVVADAFMILESLIAWELTVTVVGLEMGPMFSTRRTAAPPGAMAGITGARLVSICTGFSPVADLMYTLRSCCCCCLPSPVTPGPTTGLLITWNCGYVLLPRRSAPAVPAFITGVPPVVLIACRFNVFIFAPSISKGLPVPIAGLGLLTIRMGTGVVPFDKRDVVAGVLPVAVPIGFMVLRFK